MYRVAVKQHFDAAHFLKDYPGKCARLHGHRWVVQVTVTGREVDHLGMLVDFGLVKDSLKLLLAELDHSLINELPWFAQANPTAENLARYFYEKFPALPQGTSLEKVRVYETPESWAEYGVE